jgi:tryptophan synthase beta subunit
MGQVETVPDARGHFGPYGGMFVPEPAKIAPSLPRDQIIVVNCSGRGDKDVDQAAAAFGCNGNSKQ